MTANTPQLGNGHSEATKARLPKSGRKYLTGAASPWGDFRQVSVNRAVTVTATGRRTTMEKPRPNSTEENNRQQIALSHQYATNIGHAPATGMVPIRPDCEALHHKDLNISKYQLPPAATMPVPGWRRWPGVIPSTIATEVSKIEMVLAPIRPQPLRRHPRAPY